MNRPDGQTIFLSFAAATVAIAAGFFLLSGQNGQAGAPYDEGEESNHDANPFDGDSAYAILGQICSLGPRKSGSPQMQQQQEMLQQHFRLQGAEVTFQKFAGRDPRTGRPVPMANLIASWHPDRQDRVILCAHYDTRPFPDRDPDPRKRKGTFIGANDGGSGVAVLAELARHLKSYNGPVGIDVVLFDGEEYVFDDKDEYFLGSKHFAQQYVLNSTGPKYRYGILLDMVGDADLRLYQELHGLRWPDTRPLANDVWRIARKLGVREFIRRPGQDVRDDHLPLHDIGKIPCIDIIDFNYPRQGVPSYWHTTHDTHDKCSPNSLAKVGWVVLEWLNQLK